MKKALRLALNLLAVGVVRLTARVAQRKSRARLVKANSNRDPSNLTLLGLGLLGLAFGYRK